MFITAIATLKTDLSDEQIQLGYSVREEKVLVSLFCFDLGLGFFSPKPVYCEREEGRRRERMGRRGPLNICHWLILIDYI